MKETYRQSLRTKEMQIRSGVAELCIAGNVRFKKGCSGVGYKIPGREIVIKAKMNGDYCNPQKLHKHKIFYRFYYDTDFRGNRRPYLWMAANRGDSQYIGQRQVVLSLNNGAYLSLEKTLVELFDILSGEE